jgi:hypothetical protein
MQVEVQKHLDQNGAKININATALPMLIDIFREINVMHWREPLNFYLLNGWRNAGYFYVWSSKNSRLSSILLKFIKILDF